MIFNKVKRFLLTLDCPEPNSPPIFSSGDTVTGRVLLELVAEAKVDSIKLHAQGLARVHWSESHSTNSNAAYNQNHSEEMVYLDHQEALLQTEDEAPTVLQPGTHEFPFSFELPEHAVTSFEGKFGSVHYWVKAKLHRPWATVKKTKLDFTVLQPIDINTPALLAPQRGTKEKKAHTWYCNLGQVSLTAKIDRKGYTPGDDIVVFADIDNGTSKAVVPKVAIIQTQTYAARGITKQKASIVATFTGDSVAPRKKETWHGTALKVPPLCPSIAQCQIIRVEYVLKCLNAVLAVTACDWNSPIASLRSQSPSIDSQYTVNLEWLRMTIPEQPEPPPEYTDIVFHEDCEYGMSPPLNRDFNGVLEGPFYTYIQEFRSRPPPLYSEVDPHPVDSLSSAA